jgi:hypothetical protein
VNVPNTPEDFLSFARMVMHAHQQDWGQIWTQREIDGLFYNQFLNPSFQQSLLHVRRRFLNSDDPPYPCLWDSEGADGILIKAFGGGDLRKPELALWHRWEKPDKHGITVAGILDRMAEKFSVQEVYLTSAFHSVTVLQLD